MLTIKMGSGGSVPLLGACGKKKGGLIGRLSIIELN